MYYCIVQQLYQIQFSKKTGVVIVLDWAFTQHQRKLIFSICRTQLNCGEAQVSRPKSMDDDPANHNVWHQNDKHLVLIVALHPVSDRHLMALICHWWFWPNVRGYLYAPHSEEPSTLFSTFKIFASRNFTNLSVGAPAGTKPPSHSLKRGGASSRTTGQVRLWSDKIGNKHLKLYIELQ
jgi:hypothetical protein